MRGASGSGPRTPPAARLRRLALPAALAGASAISAVAGFSVDSLASWALLALSLACACAFVLTARRAGRRRARREVGGPPWGSTSPSTRCRPPRWASGSSAACPRRAPATWVPPAPSPAGGGRTPRRGETLRRARRSWRWPPWLRPRKAGPRPRPPRRPARSSSGPTGEPGRLRQVGERLGQIARRGQGRQQAPRRCVMKAEQGPFRSRWIL